MTAWTTADGENSVLVAPHLSSLYTGALGSAARQRMLRKKIGMPGDPTDSDALNKKLRSTLATLPEKYFDVAGGLLPELQTMMVKIIGEELPNGFANVRLAARWVHETACACTPFAKTKRRILMQFPPHLLQATLTQTPAAAAAVPAAVPAAAAAVPAAAAAAVPATPAVPTPAAPPAAAPPAGTNGTASAGIFSPPFILIP